MPMDTPAVYTEQSANTYGTFGEPASEFDALAAALRAWIRWSSRGATSFRKVPSIGAGLVLFFEPMLAEVCAARRPRWALGSRSFTG